MDQGDIKKHITRLLNELRFLKNDGLMCEFVPGEGSVVSNEDLLEDIKFQRLLDLPGDSRPQSELATDQTSQNSKTESPTRAKVVEPIADTQPTPPEEAEHEAQVTKTTVEAKPSSARRFSKHETRKRSPSIERDSTEPPVIDCISPPPEKKIREESPQAEVGSKTLKPADVAPVHEKEPEAPVETPPTLPKIESPTQISKVVEPMVSVENQQRQIIERAKHEAEVTTRISELRKQGMWSAKMLPKAQDPPRPKTHWDYLIEEMKWLWTDFENERRWKRKAAKKCALMCYRYHQEKRSKIERAEREQMQHIKKLAASQAKEVRSFWSTIEKIVDFRQQTKLEETRKKAWGLHLNYILDQTSKFSNTFLEDPAQPEKAIECDEYLKSQDGENAEKEPVINVSMIIYYALGYVLRNRPPIRFMSCLTGQCLKLSPSCKTPCRLERQDT